MWRRRINHGYRYLEEREETDLGPPVADGQFIAVGWMSVRVRFCRYLRKALSLLSEIVTAVWPRGQQVAWKFCDRWKWERKTARRGCDPWHRWKLWCLPSSLTPFPVPSLIILGGVRKGNSFTRYLLAFSFLSSSSRFAFCTSRR